MKRLLPLFFLLACEPVAEPTGHTAAGIIGGSPDEGDPAVVLLAAYSPDLTVLDLCTATLVAPDVLLTAAHCVDEPQHPDWGFGVFVGSDANGYGTASTLAPQLLPIAEILVHPDYDTEPPFTADIALVRLAAPLTVPPVPIAWQPLDEGIAGRAARIVGYGQLDYQEPNAAKHSALTVVAALDEGDTLTVGDVDHKTCVGDSGGPALVELDGVETVVGVNSYTDLAGCLEPAHYRRVDLYTDFIATLVARPEPPEGGNGEGGAEPEPAGGEGLGGGPGDGESETSGCTATGRSGGSCSLPVAMLLLAACGLNRRSTRRQDGAAAARTRSRSRRLRVPLG